MAATTRRLFSNEARPSQKNVFGGELKLCCNDPITGFYRTGYCETGKHDFGKHTVCALITSEFLDYTASKGNNLRSVVDDGDRWCLCVSRWYDTLV